MKFNKLFIPIFLSFVLILGITQPVVAAVKTSEGISNKVFRLHILANSDSTEDQNIKLMLKNYMQQAFLRLRSKEHLTALKLLFTQQNLV